MCNAPLSSPQLCSRDIKAGSLPCLDSFWRQRQVTLPLQVTKKAKERARKRVRETSGARFGTGR